MQLDHAKIVALARIAHAANREFCLITGDLNPSPVWEETDQALKDSAVSGIVQLLENPELTPEQLHQEWVATKVADGWAHGELKDDEAKTHPCLVPYAELPATDRFKDTLFMSILLAYFDFLAQPEPNEGQEAELNGAEFDVLRQLFNCGPLDDGNVASKTGRDSLIERGLVFVYGGYQSLTPRGLEHAITLGMDELKDAARSK